MHLVQLLLPLVGSTGERVPQQEFEAVRAELVERFGGLTAYSRSPARGLWAPDGQGAVEHDDIVVYEVMVDQLDRAWWAAYRTRLASRFQQQELVCRAHRIEVL